MNRFCLDCFSNRQHAKSIILPYVWFTSSELQRELHMLKFQRGAGHQPQSVTGLLGMALLFSVTFNGMMLLKLTPTLNSPRRRSESGIVDPPLLMSESTLAIDVAPTLVSPVPPAPGPTKDRFPVDRFPVSRHAARSGQKKKRIYLAEGPLLNTGVWSNFGSNPPEKAVLAWAANRLPVHKDCLKELPCEFVRRSGGFTDIDAVVVETVNIDKFGHKLALKKLESQPNILPSRDLRPIARFMLNNEPYSQYPEAMLAVRGLFDAAFEPSEPAEAALYVHQGFHRIPSYPITMTCSWFVSASTEFPPTPSR
eukprot:g62988.t1